MADFIPWNSQDPEAWAERHATGSFIELEGRRTHYLQAGNGEPLILIHGYFYNSYLWAENIAALAEYFTVYAPDLWGLGYSFREPLEYGYPLYAEQVQCFMDALGIERAHLMGQSMGGGTAVLFAVNNPDRVGRLVLIDPAGMPNQLPLKTRIFNLPGVGEFLTGLRNDLVRRKILGDLFIHDRNRLTDEYFANVTRFHKIQGTNEVLLGILRRRYFDTLQPVIEQLGTLDVPVLLVWGRHDKAVPLTCGEAMHRLLPGSRLEIFEDSGHVPNYEEAEVFNRLALDFLCESDGDGSEQSEAGSGETS